MNVQAAVQSFVLQCTTAVHDLLSWTNAPAFQGDAYTWAAKGAAAGYPVSHVPQAGDVGVFGRGQSLAGFGTADPTFGHVVAVTGIDSAGNVDIKQANWPEGSGIHSAVIPAADASQLTYVAPKGTQVPSSALPSSGPGNNPGLAVAPAGFDWNPLQWPGDVLGLVGGAAGGVLGGAVGSAAGSIGSGFLSGIAAFGKSFGDATVFPWFKRESVPLVAGLIIWGILTHETSAAPKLNFNMPVYNMMRGGNGDKGAGDQESTEGALPAEDAALA